MSNSSASASVTLKDDLTDLYTGARAANEQIPTAALVSAGLLGGYGVARWTGVRPLGGAVLFAAGAAAAHNWWHKSGPITTAALSATYLLGFGLSHPLAKKIGAWPSVLAVTGVNATAAWVLADRS
ncbi:hypothetical protein [Kocuria sp.]|uniref:hypothetical protein n=1 Tax=Kocuria sp. TaxID=1871328 RepID=UPI0026DEA43A|nr:hypothetical protein [Kocuria sp.]MDO5617420.1 hypothetical protein [Kocuria sp.]